MDSIAAELRFVQIASELSRMAARHHVVVAPESLNATETNVGNDLGILAEALLEAGVGYTADSYHVLRETNPGHEADWKSQLPHPPAHVHVADAERHFPSPEDPAVRAFAARLRELGYDSRVSLECRWENLDAELPRALESLRTLFGSSS